VTAFVLSALHCILIVGAAAVLRDLLGSGVIPSTPDAHLPVGDFHAVFTPR
jgi:hypothetical protein